jgi:hypothetical protein
MGSGPLVPGTSACPNCGRPTLAWSTFCDQCGTRLRAPQTFPGPGSSRELPVWVWVVVAVVISLAVILPSIGFYLFAQDLEQGLRPPSPPESAPLELQFSGPQCPGWANESVAIPVAGGTVEMGFTLTVQGSSGSCTAQSVSIPTPGFTLLSSNAPVTVNAGSYGVLNVTVRTPSTMPLGAVVMIVTVGAVTVSAAVP